MLGHPQLLALARQALDSERYDQALGYIELLGSSPERQRQAVRQMEAEALYRLGVAASAANRLAEAQSRFGKAVQLSDSKTLRTLAQERIKLIKHTPEPLAADTGESVASAPGVETTEYLGVPDLQPDVDEVYCAGAYRSGYDRNAANAFSRGIRLLKRENAPQLTARLGDLLAQHLAEHTDLAARVDFVVPVPTDPERYARRGYAISHLLATRLAMRLYIPTLPSILEQTRDAPELRHLPRWARANAVEGLFDVPRPEWVQGRYILIVDDIVTSGATLREIGRTLRAEGAAGIAAAALGHTERSG